MPGITCKLREIMDEKGVSAREIALHIFMSESNFNHISRGKQVPKVDIAYEIADYLDVSIEEIWVRNE